MEYTGTIVPPSIWMDQGVKIYTATKANPNIKDVEFVPNDGGVLNGTYLLSKNGEIHKTKDNANIIASIMYDGELPEVEKNGELTENFMAPHIAVKNPKEVAQELYDLDTFCILTVEGSGRTEEILERTNQVTVTSSIPRANVRVFAVKYQERYGNVDAAALIEIGESAKINEVLKGAGIYKEDDGSYRVK